MIRISIVLAAALSALPVFHQPAWAQSSRLDVVKTRGVLRCGVNPNFAGFSLPDSKGEWHGFDVDMCRAVASAVFGDAKKTLFVPLSAKDRFAALQTGDIDMLARNASWTLGRNTKLHVDFVATNFYDRQAFMVKASSNIRSAAELNGASICVIAGTDTEKNLADFFAGRKMKFSSIAYENADAVAEAISRADATRSSTTARNWRLSVFARPIRRITSFCRRRSARSHSRSRCAPVMMVGPISCDGVSSPWLPPRSWASTRRTSGRRSPVAPIRRCSVSPASRRTLEHRCR
jgi:hypothetical protein